MRAEWAQLENPARVQGLVRRHLPLRPPETMQFDALDRLPEKPPQIVQPPVEDAIASMIENPDTESTGSVPEQPEAR